MRRKKNIFVWTSLSGVFFCFFLLKTVENPESGVVPKKTPTIAESMRRTYYSSSEQSDELEKLDNLLPLVRSDYISLRELLETNGPGKRRLELVKNYFFSSEGPIPSLLEEAETLLDGDELKFALTGLQCRIALCDEATFSSIFSISEGMEITSNLREVLLIGISLRLNSAFASATMGVSSTIGHDVGISEEEFRKLFSTFRGFNEILAFKDQKESLNVFFSSIAAGNSELGAKVLLENKDYVKDVSQVTREKLFGSWIEKAPEIAAAHLLEYVERDNEIFDSKMLPFLFEKVFEVDSDLALRLEQQLHSGGNRATVDAFLRGKSLFSLRNGDFEEAKNFVRTTKDEELKKEVGWHLWKKQKDTIVKEIGVEPEKTANGFLDGTSRYEEYMLEAAVTHWIKKDPEQAADWTEANIEQMAHGPRQYVAASYAKEAAALGDMATARQWANLIQDEKTLTRINGILEKAEQAASN
ncbi:hypothetical protein [Roseibacillus persicicus]|uniref:hypothetical protein n=1 Tax=Roseibacillus persicicus TaxID=454148 RepID=UPI00280F30DD|nr:hypothetical protein [Roseibacillus persicicus]MDQ8191378.1 hypothetical protein [Roseibacillus persicicus]